MATATLEGTAMVTARAWRSRIATLFAMVATGAIILTLAVLSDESATIAGGITPVTLSGQAAGAPPTVGSLAPDFQATFVDGRVVKLSDYLGQPVWLTFGASWCQPCRSENVDIQATYERWSNERVVVLAVFIAEAPTTVADYASRVGLTYPQLADPETRIASAYRILGIPTHFFIDRTGVLRELKIGTIDPIVMDAELSNLRRWR